MHRSTLPALLLLVSSPVVAQQPAPAAAPATPTRLGGTGLEMVLPAGFVPGDGAALGAVFAATGADVGGFRENLNVTAGPAAVPKVDDAALRAEMVDALGKVLVGYEFVADGRFDVRGRSAWWVSGRFVQGTTTVRNLQVLVPGEPCHWFTFTTSDAAFAAREPAIRAALATLRKAGEAEPVAPIVISSDGKRVIAAQLGFSFEPPEGWRQQSAELAMGAFLFVAAEPVDGFAANANVRTAPGADRMDPRAVRADLEASLAAMVQEPVVSECAVRAVGGRKAVRSRVQCKHGERAVAMVQYYVPAQPQSFVVTYTVAAGQVGRLLAALDASAATISVVAPTPAAPPADGKAPSAPGPSGPGSKPRR